MVKNVILITVDCLRADHLSCYGYHKKTTPNLDRSAKKGILFTQAFSNGPWTPFSFPSILTSTYPLQYPPLDFHLSPERVMLSEILKENGYSTGAFHSNPYLSSFYGYDRGFEVFNDFLFTEERIKHLYTYASLAKAQKRMKEKLESFFGEQNLFYSLLISFYRKGEKIIKRALEKAVIEKAYKLLEIDEKCIEDANALIIKAISWLKNTKKPFFLWIHFMDVRMGYVPPEKCLEYFTHFTSSLPDKTKIRRLSEKEYRNQYVAKENFSENEQRLMINLYDAEIRYVDEHIKLLLDEIEDMGLFHDTLIIITADHGEEFLEHGDTAHNPKLYDELLHVPLIILYTPELGKNIVIDDLVSLLDLAPTILDILGIKKPEKWLGESLLPLIKGEKRRLDNGIISEVFSNGKRKTSYRTKKWKLIFDEEKNGYELYSLEKDIKENNNVAEEMPDIVKDLSFKIDRHISLENKISREIEEIRRIKDSIRKLRATGKI